MKHKVLIITIGILILLIGAAGVFAWQRGLLSPKDATNPPKFIQHDFVDLSKFGAISKFRSGSGHDFSSGNESCRSMKHYYTPAYTAADLKLLQQQPTTQGRQLPPAPTPDTAIAIYSPVDGEIIDMQDEHFPVGKQVFIVPDAAKGYQIRIFHVYPLDGIAKGSHVTAGQHIGDISRASSTDISVQAGRLNGTYISYFDVMPDDIFANYQALGISSRTDVIFSKEFRDAHPFACNGEEFAKNYEDADQEILINGWVMPQGQQNSGQSGNSNSGDTGSGTQTARDVRITLFSDATSATVSSKSISVFSSNGVMCITTPCPTEGQTFTGKTDSSGSFVLPASYVNQKMSVLVDGFVGTEIPYQQALSGTEITLRLKTK